MITFSIKTWGCDTCGYKQDFEPTQENMNVHFPGLTAYQCPSCKSALLIKVTNESDKAVMSLIDSEDDIVAMRAEQEPITKDGVLESPQAMEARLDAEFEQVKVLSTKEIGDIRTKYEDK
jgi:DNA-directed RNA polymerase subunit M/transcription elongation factor TFIIS